MNKILKPIAHGALAGRVAVRVRCAGDHRRSAGRQRRTASCSRGHHHGRCSLVRERERRGNSECQCRSCECKRAGRSGEAAGPRAGCGAGDPTPGRVDGHHLTAWLRADGSQRRCVPTLRLDVLQAVDDGQHPGVRRRAAVIGADTGATASRDADAAVTPGRGGEPADKADSSTQGQNHGQK